MSTQVSTRKPGHLCDELCGRATSPASECTCLCGGAHHGSWNVRTAVPKPRRDPFAGLPQVDDEGAF